MCYKASCPLCSPSALKMVRQRSSEFSPAGKESALVLLLLYSFKQFWYRNRDRYPGWFSEVCQLGLQVARLGIFCFPLQIYLHPSPPVWKADHITGSLAFWRLAGLSLWPTGESSEAEMCEVGDLDSSGLLHYPHPRKPQLFLNCLSP